MLQQQAAEELRTGDGDSGYRRKESVGDCGEDGEVVLGFALAGRGAPATCARGEMRRGGGGGWVARLDRRPARGLGEEIRW
jgi:hypothetical protein